MEAAQSDCPRLFYWTADGASRPRDHQPWQKSEAPTRGLDRLEYGVEVGREDRASEGREAHQHQVMCTGGTLSGSSRSNSVSSASRCSATLSARCRNRSRTTFATAGLVGGSTEIPEPTKGASVLFSRQRRAASRAVRSASSKRQRHLLPASRVARRRKGKVPGTRGGHRDWEGLIHLLRARLGPARYGRVGSRAPSTAPSRSWPSPRRSCLWPPGPLRGCPTRSRTRDSRGCSR